MVITGEGPKSRDGVVGHKALGRDVKSMQSKLSTLYSCPFNRSMA